MQKLELEERAFLAAVRAFEHIGYGRMQQIVEREWYRFATQDDLCRPSAVKIVNTMIGQLTDEERVRWMSGYRADPIFD
jgi:hypothetical protein